MLPPQELRRIAEACASIGNDASEADGFVPIRNLLARFRAQLIIRPLLVEGMLASLQNEAGKPSWAVLVDSDQYSVTDKDVLQECTQRPLPKRMRNTIAHELAHSLAFRPAEFGIELRARGDSAESTGALVKDIEQETEKLSPLLLWPERDLVRLVTKTKEGLTLKDLLRESNRLGVSRPILINRLNMLGIGGSAGLGYYNSVRNLGIGMGEWTRDGGAVLKSWPLFVNFDRNITPALFLTVSRHDRLPATAVFDDSEFVLCGGVEPACEFDTDAGIPTAPAAERMRVECSVQRTSKAAGSAFLYVLRKRQPDRHGHRPRGDF